MRNLLISGFFIIVIGVFYLLSLILNKLSTFEYFAIFIFEYIIVSILYARALIFFMPIKRGTFSLNSKDCERWETHAVLSLVSCLYFEPFIPFMYKPLWYRLYGARIGKGTTIAGRLVDPCLIKLGCDVAIGDKSTVLGHVKTNKELIIGEVELQDHSTLGVKSVLFPGTKINKGAVVGAMSLVGKNKVIPSHEVWGGIPAVKLVRKDRK